MKRRHDSLVLVVSAWLEDDGLRARIATTSDDSTGQVVCGSVRQLVDSVERIVTDWTESHRARDTDEGRSMPGSFD